MDNLKTHTMSYSADPSAFEPFFTKLSGEYNLGYKGPDTPVDNTLTIVIITALMVAPLALVAGKIFWR